MTVLQVTKEGIRTQKAEGSIKVTSVKITVIVGGCGFCVVPIHFQTSGLALSTKLLAKDRVRLNMTYLLLVDCKNLGIDENSMSA